MQQTTKLALALGRALMRLCITHIYISTRCHCHFPVVSLLSHSNAKQSARQLSFLYIHWKADSYSLFALRNFFKQHRAVTIPSYIHSHAFIPYRATGAGVPSCAKSFLNLPESALFSVCVSTSACTGLSYLLFCSCACASW